MTSPTLSGPRLAPAKGDASQLVVLVHGYGADGQDLISLAAHWQGLLPNAAFAAPNAPDRVPGAPSGFQWFGLSRMDPNELSNGVARAAPILNAFLDSELSRLGLGPDRLALVGFSQGTMLSLAAGLSRSPAAIVGFSGLLAAAPPPSEAGPPVLLAHGDQDQVIPAGAMFAAAGELGAAGYPVQWHLASGVGHGIDPTALDMAGIFLKLAFDGKLGPRGPVSCLLP
jgi:phospholipase/carboxylesterase